MRYTTDNRPTNGHISLASHGDDAGVRREARAALASLVAALKQLSAHRHGPTVVGAHALLEALGEHSDMTAQTYQRTHCEILRCRFAYGEVAQAEWRRVHHASSRAFTSLLWLWRFEVRGSSFDGTGASRPPAALSAAATR